MERFALKLANNTGKAFNGRLEKNDFSKVDEDHNAIWRLQDSSVGEATDIMSPEQEKAFIEEHYEIEE
ncbi:DUF6241 domain-containing protein [Peribacillus kribbensis]|uniref:DUF6241 domain-containing protein n=1 Tax=Peribacillus kribbensis TaxID=356658 RepID=UPI000400BF5E|nr:DUF6241 domain-containing protein [Peribacillus kribbensis]